MGRKKKVEEMRVIELQSYLKGIVDFGGADWHPSKEQWETILGLIMNLKDEESTVQQVVSQVGPRYNQVQPLPQQGGGQREVVIQESAIDGQPQQFEPIDNRVRQDLRKVQQKEGVSIQAEGGQVPSSGVTIVTKNHEADDTESDFA